MTTPRAKAEDVALPKWPDPTPEMLNDPTFNAIWDVIKTWDINVPAAYSGYCGATGNHARAILDGLRLSRPAAPPVPREPTEAMLNAGNKARRSADSTVVNTHATWIAMYDAAPPAALQKGGDVVADLREAAMTEKQSDGSATTIATLERAAAFISALSSPPVEPAAGVEELRGLLVEAKGWLKCVDLTFVDPEAAVRDAAELEARIDTALAPRLLRLAAQRLERGSEGPPIPTNDQIHFAKAIATVCLTHPQDIAFENIRTLARTFLDYVHPLPPELFIGAALSAPPRDEKPEGEK